MIGTSFDDVLIGSSANNHLTGGDGQDTFGFDLNYLNKGPGDDIINDFNIAGDTLLFEHVADFNGDSLVNAQDIGSITTFQDIGNNLIVIFNGVGAFVMKELGGLGIADMNSFMAHGGQVVVHP